MKTIYRDNQEVRISQTINNDNSFTKKKRKQRIVIWKRIEEKTEKLYFCKKIKTESRREIIIFFLKTY